MKQTRQLVHAVKQSIYLDVYAAAKKDFEKQALVAGTKQSKQANKAVRPV